jgi:hypothetical protein
MRIRRTKRATPISRVRATGLVPFGFIPVTAAMMPITTARPSQNSQLMRASVQESRQRGAGVRLPMMSGGNVGGRAALGIDPASNTVAAIAGNFEGPRLTQEARRLLELARPVPSR